MAIYYLLLQSFFIYSCLCLLFKRSENTDALKPNKNYYSYIKQNNLLFSITSLHIFRNWIEYQVLSILLLIGCVEPNPGPSFTSNHNKNCDELCSIKHKCEFPNCKDDIFAACHCERCNGFALSFALNILIKTHATSVILTAKTPIN